MSTTGNKISQRSEIRNSWLEWPDCYGAAAPMFVKRNTGALGRDARTLISLPSARDRSAERDRLEGTPSTISGE